MLVVCYVIFVMDYMSNVTSIKLIFNSSFLITINIPVNMISEPCAANEILHESVCGSLS